MKYTDIAKDLVAEHFSVNRKHLIHFGSRRFYANPRHVLAWLLRLYGLSYPAIGAEMGGRDHTTAMNSVCVVNRTPNLLDIALALYARIELELLTGGINELSTHNAAN